MPADLEIQSSSNIDLNTGTITVEIKNVGNSTANHPNANSNYHRVFEVTTNPSEAVSWNMPYFTGCPATTQFFVEDENGVTTIYYQKGPYYPVIDGDSVIYTGGDPNNSQTYTDGWGETYVSTTPELAPNDTIKFTVTGHGFKTGKTYIWSADDTPWYQHCEGDIQEIIEDNDNPSNNFFVFTYRNYAAEAAEKAALEARRLRHRNRIKDRTWQKSFFPPGRNVSVANQYHHHQMSKRAIAALGTANSTTGNTTVKKHRVGNSKPRTENGVSAAARQPRAFQQCSSLRSRSRPHHGRLISIGNGGILTPSARAVGSMDRLARLKAAAMGGTKNWKK